MWTGYFQLHTFDKKCQWTEYCQLHRFASGPVNEDPTTQRRNFSTTQFVKCRKVMRPVRRGHIWQGLQLHRAVVIDCSYPVHKNFKMHTVQRPTEHSVSQYEFLKLYAN